MYHYRRIKALLTICMLACASLWAQDKKVEIASVWASSEQGGEGADRATDGDVNTFWHSQWSWGPVFNTNESVDFIITLSEESLVDYVRYIPRQDRKDQGGWGEVEVFYNPSISGTNFISVGTFNLNKEGVTHDFYFNEPNGITCGQIKFTIRSGGNNHATAAEIEAYQIDRAKANAFAPYFEDDLYSKLKPGVTSSNGITDADVKLLVDNMLVAPEEYKQFRVSEYKAYMPLESLKQKLGVNNYYSAFENPTGIYLKKGESCIVAVSGIGEEPVSLKMRNWLLNDESSSYSLRNGLNFITPTTEGNLFVNYYTDNYKNAPAIKMHFINAPVRGYWNQETMTADDWTKILKNLPDLPEKDSSILIVQSKHVEVAYPVFCWKEYCPLPEQVDSLMTMYQQILWAERDMLGVEKYNIEYPNHQFSYVVKEFSGGAMAAGGEGTLTPVYSMDGVMTPDGKNLWVWGIAHEFGHTNQINPGLRWSGCIEVTNNIYSSWAELHVNNGTGYLRLEDEVMNGGEFRMRGGRMQAYFEEALRKEKPWMLHEGQDFYNETPRTEEVDEIDEDGNSTGQKVTVTKRNYDHFVKLTPFWQLNLWGTKAEKCKDIIPMTIQGIRTQRSTSDFSAIYNTAGKEQMNWMKLACDSAKINLLPFFEKAGMLRPIHEHIDSWNIITNEMIGELKGYVAQQGYPTPTEEINYINGHNYHIYRDELPLNVTRLSGNSYTHYDGKELMTIQHNAAQNAVAFETYNAQDELIRITMYGYGSDETHSYTQVLFPSSEEASYIMAVGYNGERQMAYIKRSNDELQALIQETEELIDEIGTVSSTESSVSLTENSYFTNAPCKDYNYGDQFTSYSVLCDNKSSTYLHTDYSDQAPNEDHYISIDLGNDNKLAYFDLTYRTRFDGNLCAPTKAVIEASNNNKDWKYLREVTSGLPTEGNASHTFEHLGNGTAYRYIRMSVFGNNTNQRANGHFYFVLSELGVSKKNYDVTFNEQYSTLFLDKNVVAEAYAALQSAKNATETAEAYMQLESKYEALREALSEATRYPVRITTDATAPVLYTIMTQRPGNPVLQYNADNAMFSLGTALDKAPSQAFYFMEGDNDCVYLYPFLAEGKVLAANDVNDGASKAKAMEKGTAAYEQWVFVAQNNGCYNLQPAGTNTYLSNYGGPTELMGFYKSSNTTDEGSLFQFVPTILEGSAVYNKLKNYYDKSSTIEGRDDAPGYFPVAQANAYNKAYTDATEALASTDKADAVYQAAYNALVNANEALEMNTPKEGRYYRFVSAVKGNGSNAFVYANPEDNKMYWADNKTTTEASAIWTISPAETDGLFNICNLHTGSSINGFIGYQPSPLSETEGDVSIVSLSTDGQVGIKCNGTMMHAQGGGAVVNWVTEANDGSAWRIVEVEDMSQVSFAATIGTHKYTSLYLNYPTAIPDGVEAYIACNPQTNEGKGSVELVELTGGVVPAHTAVILYSETPATYSFNFTTATATDNVNDNCLQGSTYAKYVAKEDNYKYYILGQKDDVVSLYWARMIYNAEGEEMEEGTHFRASANKLYFAWNVAAAEKVSGIRFVKGTTSIDMVDVSNDQDAVIYNMHGQRLKKITTTGIYIINGEKRYVNMK